MSLTHLSLFSGIGGLDLAAEWAGIQTIGQCEWAEYQTKVLEKHWPDVQRWRDIRTLTQESFYERTGRRTVDIISGGFPCQPFSVAGKQRGKEDDRYLWPEMVRVIKELRPTWVVGENVAGIVRLALPDILSELEACGYRTRTFLIPACAFGARHRRYRVAIVAHSEGQSSGRLPFREESEKSRFSLGGKNVGNPYCAGLQTERAKQQSAGIAGTGENVQYANCARRKEQHVSAKPDKERFIGWGCDERANKTSDGTAESIMDRMANGLPGWLDGNLEFFINHYWDEEPDIPRIATGVEHRVDRLKCLGNAVVPQQFYPIFKVIAEI